MYIDRLLIRDFRNIEDLELSCGSGFNFITGDNGAGKTSVLEAVHCLALARSFRSAPSKYLIRNGSGGFALFAGVREQRSDPFSDGIGLSQSRGETPEIRINGEGGYRLLDLIDHVCVQSLHPQGVELITREAEGRRSFVDWGVYYSRDDFKSGWLSFRRALKQRNFMLRESRLRRRNPAAEEIEAWSDALADLSEGITRMREAYLLDLQPVLNEILEVFLPGIRIVFELYPGWDRAEDLGLQLRRNLEKERSMGYTLYGCHRADLKIRSEGLSAGATLSRGQLKMLVYAMRLAQGKLLKQQTGRSCIYLIDDMNSELDDNSQSRLLNMLLQCQHQVFISNIHSDFRNFPIPNGSESDMRVFRLERGKLA